MQLAAFILGEQQYALPLTTVLWVVRMVEVTLLPKAPEVVLGVIDFSGTLHSAHEYAKAVRLIRARNEFE
jgi:chemotaxis signal transduction protein